MPCDLIAVDVAATILPADDSSGPRCIADVLGTSPALIERYVGAAAKISRLAIGDTDISPLSTTYKVRGDLSQDKHIEGLPPGTRGGVVIRHNFPVDGEYLFKFSLLKVNFGPVRRRARARRSKWRQRRTLALLDAVPRATTTSAAERRAVRLFLLRSSFQ
jgi:hypothetical protein